MHDVDPLDARILLALDADPQSTVVALAERLGVSRNTVHARLGRLERDGALGPVSRRLDPAALGRPLMAFVTVSVSQREGERAGVDLARIPEVIEVLETTGDADLLARVVARDTADLHRITRLVHGVSGVVRTGTVIVLAEVAPLGLDRLLRERAGDPTRTG